MLRPVSPAFRQIGIAAFCALFMTTEVAAQSESGTTDSTEGFRIEIERRGSVMPLGHGAVKVSLKSAPRIPLEFDFTLAYYRRVMSLRWAVPGQLLENCMWRRFNVDHRDTVDAATGDTIGLIHLSGAFGEFSKHGLRSPNEIRKILDDEAADVLCEVEFYVTADRTYEAAYIPITFYWTQCEDNWIIYHEGGPEQTGLRTVPGKITLPKCTDHQHDVSAIEVPWYTGQMTDCVSGHAEEQLGQARNLDLRSGAIELVSVDVIDSRGDLNMDGYVCNMPDITMFLDYFSQGKEVLSGYAYAQMGAGDANRDGHLVTASDFVYTWRRAHNSGVHFCELEVDSATCLISDSVISVDKPMQAAQVVLEGESFHKLLLEGWATVYHFEDSVTRILVYDPSLDMSQTFQGEFLKVYGNVVSIDLSTPEGAWVDVTIDGP